MSEKTQLKMFSELFNEIQALNMNEKKEISSQTIVCLN